MRGHFPVRFLYVYQRVYDRSYSLLPSGYLTAIEIHHF